MIYRLGLEQDIPDHRDWDAIKMFSESQTARMQQPPSSVDISNYCSPIENQGRIGSCASQAVIGCAELHQRKKTGAHTDVSKMFHYKAARNLLGWSGDTGLTMRAAMKALSVFGAPPERYWPYDYRLLDEEPTAFVYQFATHYRALGYYRLDNNGRAGDDLMGLIKRMLWAAHPIAFGFSVYGYGDATGTFPLPGPSDSPIGGHAVVAVGYDDSIGMLRIRNSWGTNWGQGGYGWLPYGYILRGLAFGFWCLYHSSFRSD